MIAAVEKALTAELVAASVAGNLGYHWGTVETYPDQFAEYLGEKRNLRTPACWATFLGLVDGEDQSDDLGFQARGRFAIVVAAQNKRNEEDTRHGDISKPGSYQLAIDAIRILSRSDLPQTPELDLVEPVIIRSARPVSRTREMREQRIAMMAIELELVFPLGVIADEAGEFETLHVDWDIPAHGNVAPPLPATNPDAADLIDTASDS